MFVSCFFFLKQLPIINHFTHSPQTTKKCMLWKRLKSLLQGLWSTLPHSPQQRLWREPMDWRLLTRGHWRDARATGVEGCETLQYSRGNRDWEVADSAKTIISVQSHHLFNINEIFNEVPNCRLISPSLISTGEIYCIGGSTQLQLEAHQAAGE